MASPLTPTSYAILGLLAVRPWTTYELAQQMHRALGRFWPRAQSKLYEEPKKLVALGLARASSEVVGKRPRTVYTITPAGRRALAKWVPTSGAGPVLEFEQLIKVFFAEHGNKEDLLATLDGVRDWSTQVLGASAGVPQAYLDGNGPFPERLPWLVLVGQFLVDFHLMVERWADWATAIVEKWPDEVAGAKPDRRALEQQAAVATERAPEP
jgi:DNA-binding PadR family transcriptional regulator